MHGKPQRLSAANHDVTTNCTSAYSYSCSSLTCLHHCCLLVGGLGGNNCPTTGHPCIVTGPATHSVHGALGNASPGASMT